MTEGAFIFRTPSLDDACESVTAQITGRQWGMCCNIHRSALTLTPLEAPKKRTQKRGRRGGSGRRGPRTGACKLQDAGGGFGPKPQRQPAQDAACLPIALASRELHREHPPHREAYLQIVISTSVFTTRNWSTNFVAQIDH